MKTDVQKVILSLSALIHRKKAFQYSGPKPGCPLANSLCAGMIKLLI